MGVRALLARGRRRRATAARERGAAAEATRDVLRLKYLDGGHGEGCNDEDDRFTLWRRRFHHFTFYGFMLCFASTCVATLYHYLLGLPAPYALTSLPVLLGTVGGIGLLVGPAGPAVAEPAPRPGARRPGAAADGPRLHRPAVAAPASPGWRCWPGATRGFMALLLAVHLGVVMALFLTLPYGKFAHGIFRSAALLKFAIEKRLPNRLQLGSD